jgi:hypothetical protein
LFTKFKENSKKMSANISISRDSSKPRGLFFTMSSSVNGLYQLRLPTDFKAAQAHLRAVSIKGVPVTGGVPNDLFLNLEIDGFHDNLIRNDGLSGYPLPLTGNFTFHKYEGCGLLIADANKANYATVILRLTDSLGQPAIFTQIALWIDLTF